MFLKLFDEVVKSEAIFKIKKMNARMNLLIIKFIVILERTLNEISNE